MIEKIAAAAGPLAGQDGRGPRPLLQARDRRHPRVAGARRRRGPRRGRRHGARLRSGGDGEREGGPSRPPLRQGRLRLRRRAPTSSCSRPSGTSSGRSTSADSRGSLRSKTMIDLRNVYEPDGDAGGGLDVRGRRAADEQSGHASPRHRRRRASSAATSATGSSREGHEVIAMDNLLTGNLRNIAHLEDERRFRFVRARRHASTSSSTDRSTPSCTSPRPPRRSTTSSSRSRRSRSARSAPTTRSASRWRRGRGSSSPRPPRSTATRSSTRSPRPTGATSTRSARAASTTRPSASPRR